MNVRFPARLSQRLVWREIDGRYGALSVLLGVALATIAAVFWSRHNDAVVRELLRNAQQQVHRNVMAQMLSYGHGLRGARGAVFAVGGSQHLTRQQFQRYSISREMERTSEFPGARGFGFIRRVPATEVESFVQAARADNAPDFHIRQLSPNSGERWVIQYIEPQEENEAAVGLDIASERYRREAAARAARTGEATLTGPITLVQSSGQVQQSFLYLLPVYAEPALPETVAEREQQVIGWTYAPLTMTEALANLGLDEQHLHLVIHDVTEPNQPVKFYETPASTSHHGAHVEKLFAQPMRMTVASRTWELTLHAHPAFIDALQLVPPLFVFGSVLLLSQLLFALVHAIRLGRKHQRMVQAERARMATIVENSSDAIVGESLDGRITTWNRAAEQLFGYPAAEALDRSLKQLLIPAEEQARHEAMLAAVSNNADTPAFEAHRLHRDGHTLEVQVTMSAIQDEAGRLVGVAKQMHDIGERKRSERQLKAFNSQLEHMVKERTAELDRVANLLRSVLDSASGIALIATDAQGLIVEFNRGAEQLLGYSASEVIGKLTPTSFHLESEVRAHAKALSVSGGDAISDFDVLVRQASQDIFEEGRWTYRRKDGSLVQVSVVVAPIRDKQQQITGYLGIAQDITTRLQTAEALEAAKAQAEAASAAKSIFLANMSHEIRTPMNAVVGIAHLLAHSPLNEEQQQLLAKLDTASRSLMGIINDVLDIAKIEAGEMRLENEPFAPAELVEDVCEMVRVQAQAKGLDLQWQGTSALPSLVLGDALRLRQVVLNLLSNAVKFTDQGHIQVETAVQPEDPSQTPDRIWLRCVVRDTGVGIAPEAQARLFAPFTQADASTTRRFGGTGLGLSLVKQLCTQMGGDVGLSSTLGEGSEFWFRVPLQLAPPEADAPDKDPNSLEVFVVDDQPADRMVLLRLCRALGWRAKGLESGAAMVERLTQRLQAGKGLPDALLVDWQMPGLDGLAALERLHDAAGQRQPASLIISAHEKNMIAALDRHSLVDTILTKPFSSSELFNAVNMSVAKHSGSTDRVARWTRFDGDGTVWLQGVHILVVDDSQLNLDVCRQLLEREGAQVSTAVHGLDALTQLQAEPQRFDAVLMDVQMPEMDGYEATHRLRQDPALQTLPVIALTAGALTEERARALAAGMNDFLTKPMDPPRMVAALRRAIEARRGTPLPVIRRQDTKPQAPTDWPNIPGIDMAGVAHRLGKDLDLFLLMLGRMVREFEADMSLDALHQAATHDPSGLAARMHKLRGSASLLGATALQHEVGRLEQALRAQPPASHLPTHLDPHLSATHAAFVTLAEETAPFLLAHPAEPVVKSADNNPVDEQAYQRFVKMLQEQDLAALEHYALALSAIRARIDPAAQTQLWEALQMLDFARVLHLLQDNKT